MVRWKCLFFIAVALLPLVICQENDYGSEADPEEIQAPLPAGPIQRLTAAVNKETTSTSTSVAVSNTTAAPNSTTVMTSTKPKVKLHCYKCRYDTTSEFACLNPNDTNSIEVEQCANSSMKCYSMLSVENNTHVLTRGCMDECKSQDNITCCETHLCNKVMFSALEKFDRKMLVQESPVNITLHSKSHKPVQSTVLFFVTILLLLQTVVKVTLV